MKQIFYFLSLCIFVLSACTEDKVVDKAVDHQKFLVITDSEQPRLVLYDRTDGIVNNDVYFEQNASHPAGKITKVKEFGSMIFLLMPESYKIEVIDKATFKSIKIFDYSGDSLRPDDICFANQSNAFVVHSNSNIVSILDIHFFEKTSWMINVGTNPVSIGNCQTNQLTANQIFVANQSSSNVSIIDSRTNKVEKVISVKDYPSFAAVADDGLKAVIVSLGEGKLDQTKGKTTPKATIIDVENRSIITTLDLNPQIGNASEFYPVDLAITAEDWVYVQTKTNLLRFDIRTTQRVDLISEGGYKSMNYFRLRGLLVFITEDGSETVVSRSSDAVNIYRFGVNEKINVAHPL